MSKVRFAINIYVPESEIGCADIEEQEKVEFVDNVNRRKWDVEKYEKIAAAKESGLQFDEPSAGGMLFFLVLTCLFSFHFVFHAMQTSHFRFRFRSGCR
jgi:hypothetical protein